MLCIVVDTHSVESCAFSGEDEVRHLETAFDRFNKEADANGMAVKGSWINRPDHEAFVLVDASHTHNIDEVIVSTGLVGRATTRVLSVFVLDDAVTPYTEAVLGTGAQA